MFAHLSWVLWPWWVAIWVFSYAGWPYRFIVRVAGKEEVAGVRRWRVKSGGRDKRQVSYRVSGIVKPVWATLVIQVQGKSG